MKRDRGVEGYTLPKGPQNVTLWVARSRSCSLFTRSKSRLATASGSHTFAVAASSAGIGVRSVATSSRNALRSASARASTTLEGHSWVDPPRSRNFRRKRAPKVDSSIVLPKIDGPNAMSLSPMSHLQRLLPPWSEGGRRPTVLYGDSLSQVNISALFQPRKSVA